VLFKNKKNKNRRILRVRRSNQGRKSYANQLNNISIDNDTNTNIALYSLFFTCVFDEINDIQSNGKLRVKDDEMNSFAIECSMMWYEKRLTIVNPPLSMNDTI
jgi:hypothetical protein